MQDRHEDRLGMTRRGMLGALGAGAALAPSLATAAINMPFVGGGTERQLTTGFPEKGSMILQRSRPPLLETPFSVFDGDILTPNDRFYVRWHWAVIPTDIKVETYRLKVHGHVNKEISLSLAELMAMPRVEVVAVNQCSGNSRGFFAPRVAGGQWANGAMGNARWTGVRLKDVLDRAGVKPGAVQVRFNGMDTPVVPEAPDLMKSLAIDHARDGEVILAFAMNGAQLPLLNGFPLRAVVPGWYGTYWVKMLNDLEVLASPDQNFWMKTAYTIPDTPHADMKPGQAGVKMVPINRMVPRSFITNLADGAAVKAGAATLVRGIAMGGDTGVRAVDVSIDGGRTWAAAKLGADHGKYSFRKWQTDLTLAAGARTVMVRCTNSNGVVQPATPNWNPAGFMRNVIETTHLHAA
ncbi:MAG: molybdopterin-dependent oxidoreductase [Rhodospirillales bacterium]|nr:molybdopterin-dependent oxidoreductase [Rhodospirillales bacterium]